MNGLVFRDLTTIGFGNGGRGVGLEDGDSDVPRP